MTDSRTMPLQRFAMVDLADLAVQRTHVVEDTKGQQALCQQMNESRDPFSM